MNRRPASTLLALLVLALGLALNVRAFTASPPQDPFTGTWKINLAKSHLPPPMPRSLVTHIECDAAGLTVREEIVDADGRPMTVTGKAGFDGKDYPVTGTPFADTVSYQRVDSHTIKGTSKRGGKIVTHETVIVSLDGKTMTATYTSKDAQGNDSVATAVFEKQ
jgi:hypothetical protein